MTSLTIPCRHIILSFLMILAWNVPMIPHVSGQSNYASHANNVGYQGEGLPKEALLDGRVTQLDDISPKIVLNRTKALLNCAEGSMEMEMKFYEPFFGLAYADFDRNSACQILGKGELSYKLELPLKGCGTKQDPQRVFTNNVVVRFHPGLEMDGDEIITIVCRYPPPIVLIPPVFPKPPEPRRVDPPVPTSSIQLMLIICAIMFLTLFLLGLGVSYYCLKHRIIPVVRHLPSEPSGSITQMSYHASESHPEIDDVDTRSLAVSLTGSSIYSEHYGHTQEFHELHAPIITVKEPSPKFDVQVRAKRAPLPPSPLSSDSESTTTSTRDQNNASTIIEYEESVVTMESMPHDTAQSQFSYVPELHPAEVTSHVVDDVFLRTITEKKTIEDIEKYKRMVTENKARSMFDQKWDVTIRNYPGNNQPQWENLSDISSASGMTLTQQIERSSFAIPPPTYINESGLKLTSPELVGNMKPIEIPPEDKSVANWDVLVRVLEQEEEPIADDVSSEHSSHFLQRQLSYDDRAKWKEIITTESTLKSMLTEAVVREDFERIRSDTRYERIFEPHTWDVLIRILAPPDEEIELRAPNKRPNKKDPWDTRSRRSSLPTLYEYDSDGGSSIRTITYDATNRYSHLINPQFRRTSRSSYRSDNIDFPSMSEVIMNFSRSHQLGNVSDASSHYPNRYYEDDNYDTRSIQRSLSQPSLARSASEFTERWVVPNNRSETPEGTPVASRTNRVLTTFQPRLQQPPVLHRVVTAVQQSSLSFQASGGSTSPPKEWYSSTHE